MSGVEKKRFEDLNKNVLAKWEAFYKLSNKFISSKTPDLALATYIKNSWVEYQEATCYLDTFISHVVADFV